MKRISILSFVVVILSLLNVYKAQSQLANTPWPMFQHDLQHTGRSPYKGPSTPVLKWRFQVQGEPASPVIGIDGTIYVPTGMHNIDTIGFLYAINPDGSLKWRYQFAGIPSSTTPAIASDGTIYVHMDGNNGNLVATEKLYAINSDGSLKWIFVFNDGAGCFCSDTKSSPAIGNDGTIYAGSEDTRLYAINPNGTLKWRKSCESCGISSSPAIANDGTIYISSACFEVYAFNPNGTQQWITDFFSGGGGGENSPSIGSDGTIYLGDYWGNELYAINTSGQMKWKYVINGYPQSTPAIALDSTIYIGAKGLYAINPSGIFKWKFRDPLFSFFSPVIDSSSIIYWTEGNYLFAVNPSGQEKWNIKIQDAIRTYGLDPSPAIGSDGTMYVSEPNVGPTVYSTPNYLAAYCLPAPASTTLNAPSNNSINQPIILTLSWNTSANASTYRLQVSTSSDFSKIIFDDSTITSTSKQVGPLDNNKTYYWHVNAKNTSGTSTWSTSWSFTTIPAAPIQPVLLSPSNTATNQLTNLTLSWNSSVNASTYWLQISKDTNFTNMIFNDSTITGTSKQIGSLENNKTYFWRLNAKNAGGISPWSTTWCFTTVIAVPSTPTTISPSNSAINQPINLTFSWNPSTNASTYRLQVSTSSDFSKIIFDDSTVTATSRQIVPLENNYTYYWHVNAKNVGGTSSWSTTWSFTTIPAAPIQPVLISPSNTATNQLINLTLSWNTSANASTYWLQISKDTNFTNMIFNDSIITGTSKQIGSLENNKTYYWRVNAKNAGGTSSWSTTWSFTTIVSKPNSPILISPMMNAMNISTSPILSWNTVSNATSYHLQVGSDSTFKSNLFLNDSTIMDTTKVIDGLKNNKKYFGMYVQKMLVVKAIGQAFGILQLQIELHPVLLLYHHRQMRY
jgi:outer membrane protein assembly factor BamB